MTTSPNWCPKCGGRTHVTETRESSDKLLRARRCIRKDCAHRFGTMEIPRGRGASPNVTAVDKLKVRHARTKLLALLADIDGMLEPEPVTVIGEREA